MEIPWRIAVWWWLIRLGLGWLMTDLPIRGGTLSSESIKSLRPRDLIDCRWFCKKFACWPWLKELSFCRRSCGTNTPSIPDLLRRYPGLSLLWLTAMKSGERLKNFWFVSLTTWFKCTALSELILLWFCAALLKLSLVCLFEGCILWCWCWVWWLICLRSAVSSSMLISFEMENAIGRYHWFFLLLDFTWPQ